MALPGAAAGKGAVLDQELINMKFELWRPKMQCQSCRDRDNEVALPCGHLLCEGCVEELFKNRQRKCPFDRQKLTRNEILKLYWASTDDHDF
mgnify:CR=1 FL=1